MRLFGFKNITKRSCLNMIPAILSQLLFGNLRKSDRARNRRFNSSKRRKTQIQVSLFSPPLIIDLDDDESMQEFEVECNKLTEVRCEEQVFTDMVESLVYSMSSKTRIQNGFKVIFSLLPKMSGCQNKALFMSVTESMIEEWLESCVSGFLQLSYYLCLQYSEWRSRIDKPIIDKFIYFIYESEPGGYHSSLLLHLLLDLIKYQYFSEQSLLNVIILIPRWLQTDPDQVFQLVNEMVEKGYSQVINQLNTRIGILERLDERQIEIGHRFYIKYICLLEFEDDVMRWDTVMTKGDIFELLKGADIEQSLDLLMESQRIVFYRVILKLLSRFQREDQMDREYDFFERVERLGRYFEEKKGAYECLEEIDRLGLLLM